MYFLFAQRQISIIGCLWLCLKAATGYRCKI